MRLVMHKRCTLGELDHLSLDDIRLANDALDAWLDAERRAHEE